MSAYPVRYFFGVGPKTVAPPCHASILMADDDLIIVAGAWGRGAVASDVRDHADRPVRSFNDLACPVDFLEVEMAKPFARLQGEGRIDNAGLVIEALPALSMSSTYFKNGPACHAHERP